MRPTQRRYLAAKLEETDNLYSWDDERVWKIGAGRIGRTGEDEAIVASRVIVGLSLDTVSMPLCFGDESHTFYKIYASLTDHTANQDLLEITELWRSTLELKQMEKYSRPTHQHHFTYMCKDDFDDNCLFLSNEALANLVGLEGALQQQLATWDLRGLALRILSCPTRGAADASEAARHGSHLLEDYERWHADEGSEEYNQNLQERFDISDAEVTKRASVRKRESLHQ